MYLLGKFHLRIYDIVYLYLRAIQELSHNVLSLQDDWITNCMTSLLAHGVGWRLTHPNDEKRHGRYVIRLLMFEGLYDNSETMSFYGAVFVFQID